MLEVAKKRFPLVPLSLLLRHQFNSLAHCVRVAARTQVLLAEHDDVVRQGQKLGEMGKSGTDRVKLHFEIRKQGVAVNPEPYLDGKLR